MTQSVSGIKYTDTFLTLAIVCPVYTQKTSYKNVPNTYPVNTL